LVASMDDRPSDYTSGILSNVGGGVGKINLLGKFIFNPKRMSYGNINQYFCVNNNGGNSTATLTPISSGSTIGTNNLPFPEIYGNTAILQPMTSTQAGYLNIVNASNPQIEPGPIITGLAQIHLGSSTGPGITKNINPGDFVLTAGGPVSILTAQGSIQGSISALLRMGPGNAGTVTSSIGGKGGQIIIDAGGIGYTGNTGSGGNGGTAGSLFIDVAGAGGDGTIGGKGGSGGVFNCGAGGAGGNGTDGDGGNGGDAFYLDASAGGAGGGASSGNKAGNGGFGASINLGGGGVGGNAISGTDGTGGGGATLTLGGGGSGGTGSSNGTNGIGAVLTIGPDGTGAQNPATAGATLLMQANNVGAQLQMQASNTSPAVLTIGTAGSQSGGVIISTGTNTSGSSMVMYESNGGATVNIGFDHVYSNTLTLGDTDIGKGGVVISSGATNDGGSITVNAGSSGGGNITAYGTITGGNISTEGTVNAVTVTASGDISTTSGTITASGNITTNSGNIKATSGNITASGKITAYGDITGGNISTVGTVTTTNINATNISTIGLNYNGVFFEGYQSGNIPSSGTVNLFSYNFTTSGVGYYLVTVTYMGNSETDAQYIASATVWVQVLMSRTGNIELAFIGTPAIPTFVNSSITTGPVTGISWSVSDGIYLNLTGASGGYPGTYNTKWSYLSLPT